MGDDAVGPVERSAGRATDTALASPEATDIDDNLDDNIDDNPGDEPRDPPGQAGGSLSCHVGRLASSRATI